MLCGRGAYGETLEEAWSVALAQNQRLAAARMQQVAAAEGLGAATAERLPSVSLRSAYTLRSEEPSFVVRDPLPGFGTIEFPYAQDNSASAGADLRLPIYTSGRITSAIQGAAAQQAASECETDQARLDLLLAVGEAYLTVQRLGHDVEVAVQDWESLQAHAADVASLRAKERAADNDVLAARVAEIGAWQRRLQQARALEVARGRYNRLLGRPVDAPVELAEINFPPLAWSFDQLLQVAYDRRPDIRRLTALSDAHESESSRIRGEGQPQVSASLGAQYDENRYATPQSLATAAVVMEWKLYNGGRTNRLAGAESARAASARCLVEDLKSQIAVDLLSAWHQLEDAREQGEVASQMLAHTTENLRITRLRFTQGMSLSAAVLEAQAQWAQARRDQQHAIYEGTRAHLRIRFLAGLL
jgi:outer membrane protein